MTQQEMKKNKEYFEKNIEKFENHIAKEFGKKLQELRKDYNLTQKQMAQLLSVAESTYANWEQGRREPSLLYLLLISRTFMINLEELFDFCLTGEELKRKYENK